VRALYREAGRLDEVFRRLTRSDTVGPNDASSKSFGGGASA